MVWIAGENLRASAAPAPTIAPPNAVAKTPSKYAPLPPLDLGAITPRTDVPLPEAVPGRLAGGSRYAEVLEKLAKPGTSIELPIAYRKAIASAIKSFGKKHPGRKFAVRTTSPATCGVWRTE